jgi:transposase
MNYALRIAHLKEAYMALDQQLKSHIETAGDNVADDISNEIKQKKMQAAELLRQLTLLDNQGQEFK